MHWERIIENKPFYPLPALRNKFILYLMTIFVATTAIVVCLGSFIMFTDSFDSDTSNDGFGDWISYAWPGLSLIYIFVWLGLFPILVYLIDYYVRTMEFIILDDEITVKKGIINRTVKHVPFRTITNVSSRYGIYDNIFGIGTCEIQTAGKSGQHTGPEEKIEGITNFVEVRDLILEKLRQFRSQYTTTTEVESLVPSPPTTRLDFHRQMLIELKEIKNIISK